MIPVESREDLIARLTGDALVLDLTRLPIYVARLKELEDLEGKWTGTGAYVLDDEERREREDLLMLIGRLAAIRSMMFALENR